MNKKSLLRYLLTGGLAFVIEFSALFVLKYRFHLSPIKAVAISFWIGLICAFILQKFVAFKNNERQPHILAKQIGAYAVLVVWNYIFTLTLTEALTPRLSVFVVRAISMAIIVCWNYLFYSALFAASEERRSLGQMLTENSLYESTRNLREGMGHITMHRYFARIYVGYSLFILTASTLVWSYFSARVNQSNADQLVDPLLFSSGSTFKNAQFPAAHTFLFKWPLFYIVKLFDFTPASYIGLTIAITLLTVAIFAFVLYRIERRALVFGTICLALASVLMLVPTTPAPGTLLPVNMAMLATRNLEYVLYIAGLFCVARAQRLRSYWLWGGVSILGVLAASDKLFLYLTLGGALIALIIYALAQGWNAVSISVNWLVAGFGAAIVAAGIYWLLATTHLTNIIGDSPAGPYGMVSSVKTAVLAVLYAATGLATNFGANPAFHTMELTQMPRAGIHGLWNTASLSFIVNAGILMTGIYATYQLLRDSFAHNRDNTRTLDGPARLALLLIYSALAAAGVFVATNHYYAGDARYLAIAVFAVFAALAVLARRVNLSPTKLAAIGLVFAVSTGLGGVAAAQTFQQDRAALHKTDERNQLIAQALKHRNVDMLAGDYWRSVPVRVVSDSRLNIVPLSNCTVPRDVLSSETWNKDLNKTSFAYLLSLDKNLTDFPTCSLNQVVSSYGRPNASLVIEGTLENPKELLLFYDSGARTSAPVTKTVAPATVTPISLDDLPNTTCDAAPTIMNIVAHQDDDLLFMNPDLHANITKGYCIRTVYLTAGDAGNDKFYWLKREQGAQAAYDSMLTSKQIWINRIVKLRNGAYATVSNPRGNSKITLVFMHLPDGNTEGQGFGISNFANLERLENGNIPKLEAIDGNASYSADELVSALTELMVRYLPTEVNTQSSTAGVYYHDHHDHGTTGRFARRAYERFETEQFDNKVSIPFHYYLGYPVHEQPENVAGPDLSVKESIFLEYAKFDGGVCQSIPDCDNNPAYGAYLRRQYQAEK